MSESDNDTFGSGRLRPGLRIYAIGDIHGCAGLLGRMATLVAEDLAGAPTQAALTIFLGDYLDRGPASAAVVDRLLRADFPTPVITLRGNHEQMLLDGITDDGAFRNWLANGGVETAQSYGVRHPDVRDNRIEHLRRALLEAMPSDHVAFLRETELSRAIDGYFFCHAGIRPGVPFEAQDAEMLLWIRKPFHLSTADHGKVVVHGHTPVRTADSLPNRINVDTGAFHTGRLTGVVLENATRRFLSTRP